MQRLTWKKLLSTRRLSLPGSEARPCPPDPSLAKPAYGRTETERDHDRILFATPTRRLGDKTQVFPLERNESVRTRLTHSHEVSNLARSCGTHLVYGPLWQKILDDRGDSEAADIDLVRRAIPAMLAAVGLAHDMGNPPFGHQGEEAIRQWIRSREGELFNVAERQRQQLGESGAGLVRADLERLSLRHKEDFRKFEGNAQTLRTVTRLQVVRDGRGLNLTFGTLAALMKYTVGSTDTDKKGGNASKGKVGVYASESELVSVIQSETGLAPGIRHPLAFLMEACDDAAYSVVDAEDAVKKGIVSFADLLTWLKESDEFADPLVEHLVERVDEECRPARSIGLPPSELNDVSMQLFRTHAIGAIMNAVMERFTDAYDTIMDGGYQVSLIEDSKAGALCRVMKRFDRLHAYMNRQVLEIELRGFNTLDGLMSMLWRGITEREVFSDPASKRTSPFARYAYGRISENYKRVFEGREGEGGIGATQPMRYRELQLLTDMVAGMTDQYALDLHRELEGFNVGASAT